MAKQLIGGVERIRSKRAWKFRFVWECVRVKEKGKLLDVAVSKKRCVLVSLGRRRGKKYVSGWRVVRSVSSVIGLGM